MRTWVVILTIAVILASLSVTECIIINKFCDDIEQNLSRTCDKIQNKTVSKEDIDAVSEIWDNNKNMVLSFSNHHAFTDYEDCIFQMYYFHNNGYAEEFYHACAKLLDVNKRLKETTDFGVGNLF